MLQRSPSYIMTMPKHDPIGGLLRKLLPPEHAYRASRWKNARMAHVDLQVLRKHPARSQALLMKPAAQAAASGL